MIFRLCFYDEYGYKTKQVKLDSLCDMKWCWSALVHDYDGMNYEAWAGSKECTDLMCEGEFHADVLSEIEKEYHIWENYYEQRRRRYAS